MMKKSRSPNSSKQSIQKMFQSIKKFHYFFSISLVIIGVAFIVYNINDILNHTPNPSENTTQIGFSDKFDMETIERIEKFKYRDETTVPPTPEGRINPFIE